MSNLKADCHCKLEHRLRFAIVLHSPLHITRRRRCIVTSNVRSRKHLERNDQSRARTEVQCLINCLTYRFVTRKRISRTVKTCHF